LTRFFGNKFDVDVVELGIQIASENTCRKRHAFPLKPCPRDYAFEVSAEGRHVPHRRRSGSHLHVSGEQSADGLELRFAVNYLAGFLLTRLVLEKVKAAAPARIVNVASAGQEPLDFSDLQLERDYSGYFAYCRSKVALIMFTLDLAEELKDPGVTVNTVHPGAYMNTTMVRQMKHEVVDSVDEGPNFVLEFTTHPKFDGVTGRYIDRGVDMRAQEQCYDREARRKLREISNKLAGL
jgi:NAD(P)-dependent dehydrogenase (short-subunit alcohol dehydrogenase family)